MTAADKARVADVECPECNGDGSWLPAGACGGCDFCPSPRPCALCAGTGRVFAASDEWEPEKEEQP